MVSIQEREMDEIRTRAIEEARRAENENPIEWEAASEEEVPFHVPRD